MKSSRNKANKKRWLIIFAATLVCAVLAAAAYGAVGGSPELDAEESDGGFSVYVKAYNADGTISETQMTRFTAAFWKSAPDDIRDGKGNTLEGVRWVYKGTNEEVSKSLVDLDDNTRDIAAEYKTAYKVEFLKKAADGDPRTGEGVYVPHAVYYGSKIVLPDNPSAVLNNGIATSNFDGWYTDGGVKLTATTTITPTADVTYYARYAGVREFTFGVKAFDAGGVNRLSADYVKHGEFTAYGSAVAQLPTPPTVRDGGGLQIASFSRWVVGSAFSYVAEYTPMYYVTYLKPDGDEFLKTTLRAGLKATPPDVNSEAGFEGFVGWYDVSAFDGDKLKNGATAFDFSFTAINKDVTVKAYVMAGYYRVEFRDYSGGLLKALIKKDGETVADDEMRNANGDGTYTDLKDIIAPPLGQMFANWYYLDGSDQTPFEAGVTAITANTTVYPAVKDAYTVEFVSGGTPVKSQPFATDSGSGGTVIVLKPANPSRTGYTFLRWAEKDDKDAPDFFVSGSAQSYTFTAADTNRVKKLYAIWKAAEVGYTVAFWVEKANIGVDDNSNGRTLTTAELSDVNNFEAAGTVTVSATVNPLYRIEAGITADGNTTVNGSLLSALVVKGGALYVATESLALKHAEFSHITPTLMDGGGQSVINVYFTRKIYTVYFNPRLLREGVYNPTGTGDYAPNGDVNPNGLTAANISSATVFGAATYTFQAKYEQNIAVKWPKSTDVSDGRATAAYMQSGWFIEGGKEIPHNSMATFTDTLANAAEWSVSRNIINGGGYVGNGKLGVLIGVQWAAVANLRYLDRVGYMEITTDETDDLTAEEKNGAITITATSGLANNARNTRELYSTTTANNSTQGATNRSSRTSTESGASQNGSGITYPPGSSVAVYPTYIKFGERYFKFDAGYFVNGVLDGNSYGQIRNVSRYYEGFQPVTELMGANSSDGNYVANKFYGSIVTKAGNGLESDTPYWFMYAFYGRKTVTIRFVANLPAGAKHPTTGAAVTEATLALPTTTGKVGDIVKNRFTGKKLPTPNPSVVTNEGNVLYRFDGWYWDANFEIPFSDAFTIPDVTEKVIFGKWTADTVYVSFKQSQTSNEKLFGGAVGMSSGAEISTGGEMGRLFAAAASTFVKGRYYDKDTSAEVTIVGGVVPDNVRKFDGWFYRKDALSQVTELDLSGYPGSLAGIARVGQVKANLEFWGEWSPGRYGVKIYNAKETDGGVPIAYRSVETSANTINQSGALWDGSSRNADGTPVDPKAHERGYTTLSTKWDAADSILKPTNFAHGLTPSVIDHIEWYADDRLVSDPNHLADTPITHNDFVIYAKYFHSVTFTNTGGATLPKLTPEYNATVTLPALTKKADGSVFRKWKFTDTTTGATTVFEAGSVVTITKNMTFEAVWSSINLAVTSPWNYHIDPDGRSSVIDGQSNPVEVEFMVNANLTTGDSIVVTVVKSESDAGVEDGDIVYTSPDVNGIVKVTVGTNWAGSKRFTIIAEIWCGTSKVDGAFDKGEIVFTPENSWRVRFIDRGDVLESRTVDNGTDITVREKPVEPIGNRFLWWEYGGDKFNPGDVVTVNTNMDFTAVWEVSRDIKLHEIVGRWYYMIDDGGKAVKTSIKVPFDLDAMLLGEDTIEVTVTPNVVGGGGAVVDYRSPAVAGKIDLSTGTINVTVGADWTDDFYDFTVSALIRNKDGEVAMEAPIQRTFRVEAFNGKIFPLK